MSKGKLDRAVESYGLWVVKYRWLVVIGSILVIALAVSGARFLRLSSDYHDAFGADNPNLQAFDALQAIYTQNNTIFMVIAPPEGEVFSKAVLETIDSFTAKAWKIPYTIRVDALTNFQYVRGEEEDIVVTDLIEVAPGGTPDGIGQLRAIALSEIQLVNRLVSKKGHVTALNVTLQLPLEDPNAVLESVGAANQLADQIRAAVPGLQVFLTGSSTMDATFAEISASDMSLLMPLMLLAMILVMMITLRSVSGMITSILIVLFTAMATMGIGGWMGLAITPPSASIPIIVMTLAVADSIHLLSTIFQEMRKGTGKHAAIVESLRLNMMPVFVTSISTALGFLTMNFSDFQAFHDLGNLVAIGMMCAFVLSVVFLPAFIAVIPVRVKPKPTQKRSAIDRLADFAIGRRRSLLWGGVTVTVLMAALLPLNQVDDRFLDYIAEGIPFREASDFTMDNLTGLYAVDFSLGAGGSGNVSDPAYLARLDAFATWYRSQPGVRHVSTFTDVMKRLNQSMHGDDLTYYRLPEDREMTAQYLLLYELSLPYGLDLNNQINVDKSATRFTVTLDDMSSIEMMALVNQGEQWLRDNAPASMAAEGTGVTVVISRMTLSNPRQMLIASTVALIFISLLMIVVLRSVKIGFLSLVPNLVPAVLAFGLWALLSGIVNTGIALVLSMTLGIIVDDSIHFLSKYLRARRELGKTAEEAVRYAFKTVGHAIISTTLILMIGFSVLTFSSFTMNSTMARLTVITMAFALLADFLLLPALLLMVDRKGKPSPAAQPVPPGS